MSWKKWAVVAAFVLGGLAIVGAAWMFRYEPYVYQGYARTDGSTYPRQGWLWDRWKQRPCRINWPTREDINHVECFPINRWVTITGDDEDSE